MMTRNNIKSVISAARDGDVRLVREKLKELLADRIRQRLDEREKEISQTLFQEDVVDTLKEIVKKKAKKPVRFKDGSRLSVDLVTANALVTVFDKLKQRPAQDKFKRMANKNSLEFMKLVDFAWSKVKR